jgi:hypothetical protein
MVLAGSRSYSILKRLVRSARRRDLGRASFAARCLTASHAAGSSLLALIALGAPSNFGRPGASTLHTGWPSVTLLLMVAAGVVLAVTRRSQLAWLGARIREPYARPLTNEPGFDEAADALAACPRPLRTRFALSWVWGPVLWAVVGGTFAFSSAYFVVDAILARGSIGWAQPVYALAFALLGGVVFWLAAGRLGSWRFAASVYKEVSSGYPAP